MQAVVSLGSYQLNSSKIVCSSYSDTEDFTSAPHTLTLDGSSSTACANITINDDDILEDQEEFMVTLTEDDPRVDVDRDQATVLITDNDSKTCYCIVGNFKFFTNLCQ